MTEYKTEGIKRVPVEIITGSKLKETQAREEGDRYRFAQIPNSRYWLCQDPEKPNKDGEKGVLYVVLCNDGLLGCSCDHFTKHGDKCEHIYKAMELKQEDLQPANQVVVDLLEVDGWTTIDGLLSPPDKDARKKPVVVDHLPPVVSEQHDNEEVDQPAKTEQSKKPLCVATCPFCEMEIKAATQANAEKRLVNHIKVCKKRPKVENGQKQPEEKPTMKVAATIDTKPVKKAQPTPAAVAKDTEKTYTCKICGVDYPTSDEALNCIESHQALQEIEETRALVGTTGKTSDQRWSDAQIEVMKKTVAIGATPAEFAYFLNVAKYSGLNPFLREIYFIKTEKGQVSIITARDGYLTIAKRDQRFQGVQSMEVCEKDTFTVDTAMDESGNIAQVVHHQITNFIDRGDIIGAWARGQMRGEEPVIIFTSMKEYDKGKQPKGGKMWNQYPSSMIRKIAEAMVLKRIAGISGLVTDAEINTDLQIVDAEVI